ncbi:hypothetical protein M430DRAFT_15692 [Amorphotheca resinae ATCC 22711]|uniref:Uncharacterized protein n=1 Tax=Amorphotheca resinae ATCC 22711 TaxID=857342 RepID=A0A2T3BGG2_AMORE|nr:hypothetical protein M430DRAFT_15692 [Amorphotheca resinae ATCC 22711]PSS28481.1 hypothetical protein M430DRAFT_15692 [Amorphotheca resinae ATCC 22711]
MAVVLPLVPQVCAVSSSRPKVPSLRGNEVEWSGVEWSGAEEVEVEVENPSSSEMLCGSVLFVPRDSRPLARGSVTLDRLPQPIADAGIVPAEQQMLRQGCPADRPPNIVRVRKFQLEEL